MTRNLIASLAVVTMVGVGVAAPLTAASAATSHAAWLKAADAICTKGDAALAAAIQKSKIDPSTATPAQLKTIADIIYAAIDGQRVAIGKLPQASGDSAAIKKMLATLQTEEKQLKANPKLILNDSSLGGSSKQAKALGLQACGS